MATSKQPLKIDLGTIFQKSMRGKSTAERKIIGQAINAACDAWGHPHLHAGTGIRRLRGNFFECRSGLKTRLVFEWMDEGMLYFHLEGNHDEIHRFLKRHG
jgi:hypothetical protein